MREMVHVLKYQHVRPAAHVLGRVIAESAASLVPEFTSDRIIVVPVPLHRSRLRDRGFNQAELLARATLKHLARISPQRFELSGGALIRRRSTDAQVGLTREERMANLRGAFRVSDRAAVRGQEILLIDDVLTTGATVEECSRVLLKAGARHVWVATAARALRSGISASNPEGEEADANAFQPALFASAGMGVTRTE